MHLAKWHSRTNASSMVRLLTLRSRFENISLWPVGESAYVMKAWRCFISLLNVALWRKPNQQCRLICDPTLTGAGWVAVWLNACSANVLWSCCMGNNCIRVYEFDVVAWCSSAVSWHSSLANLWQSGRAQVEQGGTKRKRLQFMQSDSSLSKLKLQRNWLWHVLTKSIIFEVYEVGQNQALPASRLGNDSDLPSYRCEWTVCMHACHF